MAGAEDLQVGQHCEAQFFNIYLGFLVHSPNLAQESHFSIPSFFSLAVPVEPKRVAHLDLSLGQPSLSKKQDLQQEVMQLGIMYSAFLVHSPVFLPSSARFVGVLGAQVFSVVTRTFIQTQTFTIADRATRFGTVNEHPVGVGIALLVFFPHGAPGGIGVDAFGFVSRAKLHGLGRVFSHFFESSLVFINFILRFILGQAVSDEFVLFLSLKCKARFAISELAALDRCGDTVGTSQVSSASTGTTRVDAKVAPSLRAFRRSFSDNIPKETLLTFRKTNGRK